MTQLVNLFGTVVDTEMLAVKPEMPVADIVRLAVATDLFAVETGKPVVRLELSVAGLVVCMCQPMEGAVKESRH